MTHRAHVHRHPWWLLLLPCLIATCMPAQAQYRWPTLEFEVFAGNPYTGTTFYEMFGSYEWLESENLIFAVDDDVAREIERAFHEAAVWYQGHGFPPPVLEPIVNTASGPRYRVYVCSYDWEQQLWDSIVGFIGLQDQSVGQLDQFEWSRCGTDRGGGSSNAGAYAPSCNVGSRNKVIYINQDAAIGANGKLNELGYQTLAHELMHAITPNTALGRSDPNCRMGKWISEGIADAIGWDITEEIWADRYTPRATDADITKRWGYRPYFERLPQRGHVPIPGMPANVTLDATYASSSFWRFITNLYPKGWNVLVAAGRSGPPGLLDLPLEGTGWGAEVNWLDQGLRANFNYGLNAIFSSFVGHFAYSVAPFGRYRGKEPESQEVMDHWTNLLFEACTSVDLSAAPRQDVTLNIKGLGARCLWVEPMGIEGAIQVAFQAGHDDETLLDDIWISRPGTTLAVRASNTGHLPNGPTRYIATWKDFPQHGNERTLYLVSNLARNPDQTREREFKLTVSIPANTNSVRAGLPPRKYVPPPGSPTFKKRAKTLNKQRSATQKMINDQMNEDKKSLSENTPQGTQVSRHPKEPDCPEPFKYSPCGPQMSISLTIMPGTYIAPGQANAMGGQAAQVMGGMMAMAQTSIADSQEVMTDLVARIDAIDGSSVNITTPLFDYGFGGSFDNARISIRMSDGESYSTFGPPDENGHTPLTGRVSIEEYTPYVLRGSFIAPLADFVAASEGDSGYRLLQTVTGTFTSVAPWQSDERVQFVQDTHEEMADDIMNSLGVPADMAWSLKEDGVITGQEAAQSAGGGNSAGTVSTECTCECETRPLVDELCALLCEEEFAACEAD